MKCVLNGKNAATLAKVIHSFARIGMELYLEANPQIGLSLRTVNMTKSAFSSILFNLDFFSSFVVKSKATTANQCKLSMKSCLGVFRNMKQVESCMITLDTNNFKLVVQFKCRLETIKTHHISILEQETLQAVYFTDRSLNVLGANHKLFTNIVTNFKANEEELSIKATEQNIVVQNYAEGTHVDNRFVRTQITIKPEEFESYKIGEGTTITFCMRELRAILNFAESMNASIAAHFDSAGKPVVFVIKDFDTFEANLVMSTLSPEDQEFECQRSRSLVQFHSQTTDNISLDKTHAQDKGDAADEEPNKEASSKKRQLNSTAADSEFSLNQNESPDVVRKKRKTSIENRRNTHMPSAVNSQSRVNQKEISAPPIDLESEHIEVVFEDDSPELDQFGQNNAPQSIGMNMYTDMNINADMDVEARQERDNNQVNVRDHRPLIRSVFKRCFTGNTPKSQSFDEILVECSDEE